MVTFDPSSAVVARQAPPTQYEQRSPVKRVLEYVASQDESSFEVVDLLGYPTATWKRYATSAGLLWRTPKEDGTRRYYIVKRGDRGEE